ncbi:6,7,8-trihydroxycoumarin synthase-like [Salvia hispanica]|uniref:6,7,8-trihydroxycoumarin synthase-like n=1 Tax=Salvia hispanica TaxID=49212 RepID=UPI002009124C|nr:6,7,8-trihydroxycoumarin synthase-like [Salvia hispanica]
MRIVVAIIISSILVAVIHKMSMMKKKKKKGPRGVPVLGNLLQFDKSQPLVYLQELHDKYGGVAYLRHGSTPVMVVSSARLAKQVLKSHDNRPAVLGQQKLSYDGADIAFSPYDAHWKEMRRLCAVHLFSPKQLVSFRPIREAQVGRMMSKLRSHAVNQQAANLSDMAMSLASNIICGVAFGKTYEDEEYEKKKLDKLVLEAQALMVSFYFSDQLKVFRWLDRLSGLLNRVDKNFKDLDSFYQNLIDDHLTPCNHKNTPTNSDIIDLMIQLKREKPDEITWEHVKGLLMNLFVAGTDTVAAAVVWTMTGLMLRPDVMRKTQEHVREAVGLKKEGAMIEEEELTKLTYLKAVVMEGLRLYPPAPLLYRAEQQGVEEIEGWEVEKGTKIIINGWAVGRDPEVWKHPEEFVPERFLNGSGSDREWEFKMLPFGGGRRGCPGMGMGMLSIHLALANLLYSFDWVLPSSAPPIDTHALPGLTMHKKNPLLLIPIPYPSST